MPEKLPYNLEKTQAEKLIENERKKIALTPEQEEANQELIKLLSSGDIGSALDTIDYYSLPEELITSLEIKQATREGLINILKRDKIIISDDTFNFFIENLPREVVQQVVKQTLIECLFYVWIDRASEIKNKFSLSEEIIFSSEVQQAAEKGMVRCLTGDIILAKLLRSKTSFLYLKKLFSKLPKTD